MCYASDRRRTQFETSTTKMVTDGCGTASSPAVFERMQTKALSAHNDSRGSGGVYGDHGYHRVSQLRQESKPAVMLATLSFFYAVQAQAAEVSLAWDGSTSSWVAGYQRYYGLTMD